LRSVFAPRRPAARTPSPARRLALEALEDRTTPSTGGLLDATFGTGGVVTSPFATSNYDFAYDVLVQPDGKVVTTGKSRSAGTFQTGYDFTVARYNANGTLDTTFGTGGLALTDFNRNDDVAYAVALQPGTGGKVLAAGYASVGKTKTVTLDFALVRY